MTFISYAQNFEDIMLWRALKHVENGFYIDVGANDPTVDSVTLAFYERGWRGINVEPMRQYYDLLLASRPRDINLPLAVGDAPGKITFFDVPDTGLSTMDPDIAQRHIDAGRKVIEEHIEVATLAGICEKYVQGPIHFLKIDVEGFEAAVLRGMDFGAWRPWILVIEATKPQTQVTAHDEWEHMVLGADYRFAYFDGLNQFYVADEHAELLEAFKAPPNFFDEFQLRAGHYFSFPTAEAERKLHEAEIRAVEAEVRARNAEAEFANAEAEAFKSRDQAEAAAAQAHAAAAHAHHVEVRLHELNAQLIAVYASKSWRITRPLRGLLYLARQPAATIRNVRARKPSVRSLIKRILARAARAIITRPRLKKFLDNSLARFPGVDARMRALMRRATGATATGVRTPEAEAQDLAHELHKLPISARRVLEDLDRSVGQR